MNLVILHGRLGRDPETKYMQNGDPVTNFSMATDASYMDKAGNRVDRADWHSITAFGRLAETCGKYLVKGSECIVQGKLKTRTWEDQAGAKRYKTEVHADRVQFVGRAPGQDQGQPQGQQTRTGQGQQQGRGTGQGQPGGRPGSQGRLDGPPHGMDEIPF